MTDNPVTRGAALLMLDSRRDVMLDANFRVVQDYHVGTDTSMLRLDVKIGANQFNIGFHVRNTTTLNGERIRDSDDLIMPRRLDGVCVRVNHNDLITALRGLADRLEQQIADDVEAMKP